MYRLSVWFQSVFSVSPVHCPIFPITLVFSNSSHLEPRLVCLVPCVLSPLCPHASLSSNYSLKSVFLPDFVSCVNCLSACVCIYLFIGFLCFCSGQSVCSVFIYFLWFASPSPFSFSSSWCFMLLDYPVVLTHFCALAVGFASS